MRGPIHRYMTLDHERLDEHLARADAEPSRIDLDEYQRFRVGILRHIGIEEKVLLPTVKALRGGDPLPVARQLRLDHSALATLLVPTPTPEILAEIRRVLTAHNPLEEDAGGMYDEIERLLPAEQMPSLLERLRTTPDPKVAPYFDDIRVRARIVQLLREARGEL